jgi:hypothetical protein
MTTIQDIEKAVSHLPEPELGEFRAWFADFDAQKWDNQIEADAIAGKLDKLAELALQELEDGRCQKL